MRINKRALRVVLAFALFVGSFASASAQTIKIVGFGDSITNGWPYYKSPGNGARWGGYEPTLESRLVAAGHDAVVLNYGWSGESTFAELPEFVGGRQRIAGVLAESKPDFVLLMQGTNDLGAGFHAPVYPTNAVVDNLSAMIDVIRSYGATPILATLTPDLNEAKDISGINSAIKALAVQKKVVLADHHAAVESQWPALTADGLHPNTSGYEALADTWFKALLKHLVVAVEPKPVNLTPILQLLLD